MTGPPLSAWLLLAATVGLEVIATLSLKASGGFTEIVPSVVAVTGYTGAVVTLALVLRTIPMSVAYVVWTGAGTAGVVLLGRLLFADEMSLPAWAGVCLVVLGVVLINARRTPTYAGGPDAPEEHAQRP